MTNSSPPVANNLLNPTVVLLSAQLGRGSCLMVT